MYPESMGLVGFLELRGPRECMERGVWRVDVVQLDPQELKGSKERRGQEEREGEGERKVDHIILSMNKF